MLSKIFEVRSVSHNGKIHSWGARYTRAEAEQRLIERFTGPQQQWAERYHKKWWIEEIDTTGLFVIPSAPAPRERYATRVSRVETEEGTWNTLRVDVLQRSGTVVTSYTRNHPELYRTFEPFRQGERMLALVSPDYTASSVIDLTTGDVIAREEPHPGGVCPAGFYVPDWWDLNDGSILPGSMYWNEDREAPAGGFGFVWGCTWGDDSSWKVQYLDLSEVQDGILRRDDRFGYVELATNPKLEPHEFIHCSVRDGKWTVRFSVLSEFDLRSGKRDPNELE